MQLHIEEAHFHITQAAGERIFAELARSVAAAPSAPPPPNPIVGLGEYWPGEGGLLVATLPALLGMPARRLIASCDETQLAYGGYDHDTSGAASHVDARTNMVALAADSVDHPAAKWCAQYKADGHEDWFLPARFDMLMAYYMAPKVFNTEGWYLTSTQASRNCAFVQDFADGNSNWTDKANKFRVRAFRQINVNP